MLFQDTPLDLIFHHFIWIYAKKCDFGTPSKSSGRQLATQITQLVPKCCKNLMSHCSGVRPWNRLVLQRLPDTTKASFWVIRWWILGPSELQFRRFWDKSGIVSYLHSAKPSGNKLNAKYLQRTGKEQQGTSNNERSRRNSAWHFAISETTSAATNLKLLNQGAAVCAPHGA